MIDPKIIIDSIQTIPVLADIIKIVRKNDKPLISIKHLVVKSDFVLNEILGGQFKSLYDEFHAKRVYLHENEVFVCLKEINRGHAVSNYYNSWDETPVSDLRDKNSNMFDKIIDIQELKNLSEKFDPMITGKIIEGLTSGNKVVDIDYFCKVTYFYEECGGNVVNEIIEFRPIWLVLLWIENLSDGPVEIDGYTGKMYYPNSGLEFRELSYNEGENYSKNIPFNVLQKGESILIPEYILLSPIESYLTENNKEIKYDEFGLEFGFTYNFTNIQTKDRFHLIGPSLSIREVNLGKRAGKVHEFDVTNMLTVSEIFNVGSCPYVIGYKGGKFFYIKDILTKSYEEINIRNYKYIIVVEIEDEITFLEKVIISDENSRRTLLTSEILEKGNFIVINNLKDNTNLSLYGKYYSKYHIGNNKYALVYKYQNLKRFISHLTTSANTGYMALPSATPKLSSATSFIRKTLYVISSIREWRNKECPVG